MAFPSRKLPGSRDAITISCSNVTAIPPTHPVILSEVRRSRTESKDPIAVWAELNLESISIMDHQYWTYIASLSGTLYIGMTNNIERRIWEHKNGIFEGELQKNHLSFRILR